MNNITRKGRYVICAVVAAIIAIYYIVEGNAPAGVGWAIACMCYMELAERTDMNSEKRNG